VSLLFKFDQIFFKNKTAALKPLKKDQREMLISVGDVLKKLISLLKLYPPQKLFLFIACPREVCSNEYQTFV